MSSLVFQTVKVGHMRGLRFQVVKIKKFDKIELCPMLNSIINVGKMTINRKKYRLLIIYKNH